MARRRPPNRLARLVHPLHLFVAGILIIACFLLQQNLAIRVAQVFLFAGLAFLAAPLALGTDWSLAASLPAAGTSVWALLGGAGCGALQKNTAKGRPRSPHQPAISDSASSDRVRPESSEAVACGAATAECCIV